MNIEMPRGDQFPVSFKIKNKADNSYVSEVDDMYITFREKPFKSSKILFQKTLKDITFDSETNKWRFMIEKEDTEKLSYGVYGYDIEITIGDLIRTKTGSLTLTDEYTMED